MSDPAIDSQERHDTFIQQVTATNEVWGLKGPEGWCVSTSMTDEKEDRTVMPFWSDRALAKACAIDDWKNYAPSPISLKEFLEDWLPGMNQDKTLAGTNWNTDLIGMEIEPVQLNDELVLALKAQE